MTSPVLSEVDGVLGRITLNRPAALNSLTHEMVGLIDAALDAFQGDDAVTAVALEGAGDRAFCAGGDIRAMHDAIVAGNPEAAQAFWADEYRLNLRISRFAKPVVALMDGITMGGGVGLSAHASVRIVTERSVVAMPEVGIGFHPDVGGSWLLAGAPGELGTHLALTAGRADAGDAISCGLADHYVQSARIPALLEGLAAGYPVTASAEPPPEGKLHADRGWIDSCYSFGTVEEIVSALMEDHLETVGEIASRSPTSLKVTLRMLREARHLPDLATALVHEFRASTAFLTTPDFVEGVRAMIVDKDRNPKWSPRDLDDVRDIGRYFAPLEEDLSLGGR